VIILHKIDGEVLENYYYDNSHCCDNVKVRVKARGGFRTERWCTYDDGTETLARSPSEALMHQRSVKISSCFYFRIKKFIKVK